MAGPSRSLSAIVACIALLSLSTSAVSLDALGTEGTRTSSEITLSIPVHLTFDADRIEQYEVDGFSWFYHPEGSLSPNVGEPALPVLTFDYAVHPHLTGIEFTLERTTTSAIRPSLPVMGVPEPVPYGLQTSARPSPPRKSVIGPLTVLDDGFVRGVRIASVRFDPMVLERDGSITVCSELWGSLDIKVPLTLLREVGNLKLRRTSAFSDVLFSDLMNPRDIHRFGALAFEHRTSALADEDVQYVIITDSTKTGTSFSALKEWKVKKGVPSKIVDMSFIKTNYTGTDNAEKVRNFIKDAVSTWDTEFVLIGGDTGVVPTRLVYVSANGYSSSNNPTDLYYSDLDGSFNSDGDSTWGETSDNVDLRPDVFVGRAPVQSVAEANDFVTKTLAYEKDPPKGYLDNATLAGEYLDSYTNSSMGLDNIKTNLLTANFRSNSLFDRSEGIFGNLNKPNFMASVNKGASLVFHAGHSNWNVMSVGTASNGDLYNGDIQNYNGGYKVGVLSSVGCIANKFDQDDCIAELHVREPDGGTVAFIGNSNYGWYSPGAPGSGPSDVFQYRIAHELFANGMDRVGTHFAEGKDYYTGYSGSYNSYRWIEMVLNLIGDPEMYVRTAEPTLPNLTVPDRVGIDVTEIDVTVRDQQGLPARNALVCLEQEGRFEYNRTDEQGVSRVPIPWVGRPFLNITVTGQNFIPYISNITLDRVLPRIVVNGPLETSTGDGLMINCSLYDEFGISGARIEHYTQTPNFNGSGEVPLVEDGGYWKGSVLALSNSTEPVKFRIVAFDGSMNRNDSEWMTIVVVDNDLPELIDDMTRVQATTGDPHLFSVRIRDNIGVDEVVLRVGWSGEDPFWVGPMLTGDGTIFEVEVPIPPERNGLITYRALMSDLRGNFNGTDPGSVHVVDDDLPQFLEDLTDAEGSTNDPLSFRVRTQDNIGVLDVRMEYWTRDMAYSGNATMVKDGTGIWTYTMLAPPGLKGTIEHRFTSVDTSGNRNISRVGETIISDNDAPVIILDNFPVKVTTGDDHTVAATVIDNTVIGSVHLVIDLGKGYERVEMSRGEDGRYSTTVQVPHGSLGQVNFHIEAMDASGNLNASHTKSAETVDNDAPRIVSTRSHPTVKAGSSFDVFVEAYDNVALGSAVLSWWLSSESYRNDLGMYRDGGLFSASIIVDENSFGYIYWTAVITDTSGNSATSRKGEVRIVEQPMVPGPIDDGDDVPWVPHHGEDRDADGMDDMWESSHGLDWTSDDAVGDLDGDGASNLYEFERGTSPSDPLNYPIQETTARDDDEEGSLLLVIVASCALLIVLVFIALLIYMRRI